MYGSFDDKALDAWDFARCQRKDGTYYGTSGKCRKGSEVGAKEVKEAQPKTRRGRKALEQATPEQLQKLAASPKVTPAQKAVLEQAAEKKKKEAPAAPPEPKGYKPKEREERKGLRGLKDRLLSGAGKKELDSLVPSKEEIYKARDGYKGIIGDRLARGGGSPEDRERLFKSLERADKNADLEVARMGTNKKFAQDLKANLPPKVKATVDKDNGEIILSQKVGKNTIETTFNQKEGFNYRVNGKYDAGTVKDRKEQLRVAMAVRGQYDALVRSLPEGTVIKTSPYDGDGGGDARQKAYERIGFGKPNNMDEMFAMKKNGKMVPATEEQHRATFENPDTVWFAEGEENTTKLWLQIITGRELK